MSEHTGKFRWHCELCDKGFNLSVRYKDHMRKHEGKYYKCDICGKKIGSKEGFGYHMNEHTNNFKNRCELCGKGFNRPWKLKKHMENMHKSN